MTTTEDLLNAHAEKEGEIQAQMSALHAELAGYKATLTQDLAKALTENPEEKLEVDLLSSYLDSNQVLQVVEAVSESRTLRESELTDDLFFMVERKSYNDKDFSLGEAIFSALPNDRERLRFALFCGGICSIYRSVPLAELFLQEHFLIQTDYSPLPNYLRWNGYNMDLHEACFELITQRRCHDGLDKMADTVLALLSMGYRGRMIQVFEHSLSINGNYHIKVEAGDDDGEWHFHLDRTRYGRDDRLYTGQGDLSCDRLTDVFTYVADHHWYEDPNEDDED